MQPNPTPTESPVEPPGEACGCGEPSECQVCLAEIEAEAWLLERLWFQRVDLGGSD